MILALVDFYAKGNKAKFAQRIGVKPQTINMWLTRNTFDAELIHRTCMDISTEWLLSGKGDMVKKEMTASATPSPDGIPMLPIQAMAGALTGEVSVMDYECDRYIIPSFRHADFLVGISGTSMMPSYMPGDIVACRRIEPSWWQFGRVYVLDTLQGAIIKRIKRGTDDSRILITSDNSDYEPYELPVTEVRGAALVVGLIRSE